MGASGGGLGDHLRDGGVVRDGQPGDAGVEGVVMSTMILPASASPYWLTTGTALSNSTARMTISPAGAAPHVPAVAPLPSALARAAALAALRPITSTALPPLTAKLGVAGWHLSPSTGPYMTSPQWHRQRVCRPHEQAMARISVRSGRSSELKA